MAAPIVVQVYPADGDTGIPIGKTIEIIFDKGIDLISAQNHVVLYGNDFDQTSGPNSALWIDPDTGNNPYFLRSPGFKGLVELTATATYVELTGYTDFDPGVVTGETDEVAAAVGHKLILTPREQLAADTEYTLHILGDPDTIDTGISSRTIFDVVPDPGNSGSTGIVNTVNTYSGQISDTMVIEITTGGDIGTAKYKWYYDSTPGDITYGVVTNRRSRRLIDDLQIRFTGSGFVAGDIYRFNVEPVERLVTSYKIVFTTNDGTYTTAPTSPSTPATSTAPSTILPPAPSASTTPYLTVLESIPKDDSYNNKLNTRTITIVFDDDIDPTTITQDTVKIYKYPVSGKYGQYEEEELQKILTLVDDTLTIEI